MNKIKNRSVISAKLLFQSALIYQLLLPQLLANVSELSQMETQSKFSELYGIHGDYQLQTPAGPAFTAPLTINHQLTPSSNGLSIIHGSFDRIAGNGGRIKLKTVPFQGDGLDRLYTTQYFSGWRWFWLEVDHLVASKIQGGFYDLGEQVLPTSESYTFNQNFLTASWIKPTAAGYNSRIVVVQDSKPWKLDNTDIGEIIYTGDGQTASTLIKPVPGHYIQVGFFGVFNVDGVDIDSGSGVQYWPNDAGTVEPIGGIHKASDLNLVRKLITIPVPRVDLLNKRNYTIIPENAPPPLGVECTDLTTPTTDCFLPWPSEDQFLTIKGVNLYSENFQLKENGIALDSTRIKDWRDDIIYVSLPKTLLTTFEPCLDLEYHISSTRDLGLESNRKGARLINANFHYAQMCNR